MSNNQIYNFCKKIFPINRSITGEGVRKTLQIIQNELPSLNIKSIQTGTKCFDWEIPKEWNINEAYIIDPDGQKICDFKENNLHLVGYSIPTNICIELDELEKHLHSLSKQPNAIPYVTSYYKENWGFCISHSQRLKLKRGTYKVLIDSSLKNGELNYGELLIKGKSKKEVFLSTYICHPSMANNEASGPAVVTFLAKYINSITNLRYSYRIIFIPETIGSIAYLSMNLSDMKKNIEAGFNITCVGDDKNFSFLPSRFGNTLADKIALYALEIRKIKFKRFSFIDRGSDERQYCFPGVDLPLCSVMRSKYGEYAEYHTSLDNLDFISSSGLNGTYEVYKLIIDILETNYKFFNTTICEPQLGKRGMYPNTSTKDTKAKVNAMMNLLVYCDGNMDLVDIAELIEQPYWEIVDLASKLENQCILKKVKK
jgi:aminopeptidase-like protein